MTEDIVKTAPNESFWDFKGAVGYVDKWFMMRAPYWTLLILGSYLYFILRCGPKFMQNRRPYKLRRLLIVYNALQVAFSLYIFYIGTEMISEVGLVETKSCILDDEARKYRILRGIYIYHIAKLTELLDTVFFVLRKKWNQISFLHVYHHSIMFSLSWVGLKYEPTYSVIFLGTLNSFVHVIMYTYYALSAFPGLEKYLWWKKYITKMQLIQFMMIIIQMTCNYFSTPCPPSYLLFSTAWIHALLFIYLFTDFYVKSYLKGRKDKEEESRAQKERELRNRVKKDSSSRVKNTESVKSR